MTPWAPDGAKIWKCIPSLSCCRDGCFWCGQFNGTYLSGTQRYGPILPGLNCFYCLASLLCPSDIYIHTVTKSFKNTKYFKDSDDMIKNALNKAKVSAKNAIWNIIFCPFKDLSRNILLQQLRKIHLEKMKSILVPHCLI